MEKGKWGVVLPTFLHLVYYAQDTTSDEILDTSGSSNSDPSKITLNDLENIPEKSMSKPYASSTLFNMRLQY